MVDVVVKIDLFCYCCLDNMRVCFFVVSGIRKIVIVVSVFFWMFFFLNEVCNMIGKKKVCKILFEKILKLKKKKYCFLVL